MLAVFCFLCAACRERPSKEMKIDYARLRDTLDSLKRNDANRFTPVIGPDRHFTIRYEIHNGGIVTGIDTSDIKIAYGKMPKMPASGTFQVVLLNKANRAISTYYISNPFFVRVESGGRKSQKRISEGSFYIRLPIDKSVTRVQFLEIGQRRVQSDIGGVLSLVKTGN